jgi:transposase
MAQKTIRCILHPLRHQQKLLSSKAHAIPSELLPTYERGKYPKGSARIVSNAIQKIWMTMRAAKQIPLDKQSSSVVKKNGVLFLKFQKELIPIRIKEIPDLDDLLLHHYRACVAWYKKPHWIADVLVDLEDHYDRNKPEAVIGIDLGKFHDCYSIWDFPDRKQIGKEIGKGYNKFGEHHQTMEKILRQIGQAQANFEGSRRQLKAILKPLYEKRKMTLRQYYGTLRNRILSRVPEGFNAVFVVEDLEDLPRRELRKAQRKWACHELANGIFASQIEWNGYKLVKINPRGTTHTCWKCGATVKSYANRKIICPNCYPKGVDRDLNAARNIARRYMLSCISEHSCTENVRLPSESYMQIEDNGEMLKSVSERNELPILVAGRLQ